MPKHRVLCLSLSLATGTLNVGEKILAKSVNPKVDKKQAFFGFFFFLLLVFLDHFQTQDI